jgi:formylglycine-generating enzyme required for sulfatase activity
MNPSEDPKPQQPQQSVTASDSSSIRDVVQLAIGGDFEGDFVYGNKIYNRSELEELDEYLKQAVATYETRMYQVLLNRPSSEEPYKALKSFTMDDAPIFFGRESVIEELHKKVLNNRITILHGRSGAGKTSLVNAGLCPALIGDGRLPVYVPARPYEENLVLYFKKAIISSSLGPWPSLLDELSMNEFLGLVCSRLSRKTQELIVIFDQFDQFLTTLPEAKVRLPFIKALGDCYGDATLPVRFIISLREENLADLDEFEPAIPHILQNRYRLPPMSESDIQEAITQPLQRLKKAISIEPELLERLLTDLGGDNVELTHLQIVCDTLYHSLPEGETLISTALYVALGKAEKILTDYLESTLSTMPRYKQDVARIILKELVSSEATNRILRLSDLLKAIPPDVTVVEEVLTYLVDNRLLRRGEVGEENEYELVHAYLAREVFHWIGQDDLKTRRAQELLQRDLANWRLYHIPPDPEELNILKVQVQYLTLDRDAREMVFIGSLEEGHDVDFWIEQMEDRNSAARQAATFLLNNKPKREEIADSLKRGLAKDLQADVLAVLRPIIRRPKSPQKREAAETLWMLRDWLSREETSRLRLVLFPVWARRTVRSNARPLAVTAFFSIPLLVWFFFFVERPVPGQWAVIPEGSFVMGMDAPEAEYANAFCLDSATESKLCDPVDTLLIWSGRQATATLEAYSILDNEVTFAQYEQCVHDGKCDELKNTSEAQRGTNLPATKLTWLQAEAYCEWLGGRLPTEAEWEKAARGPDGSYFPWGSPAPEDWDPDRANIEHVVIGSAKTILQFAETDVSVYGVKNMAGNVQEWTATEFRPELYFMQIAEQEFSNQFFSRQEALEGIEAAIANHPSPEDAAEFYPVVIIRGGSWKSARSGAFASQRIPVSINQSLEQLGFRCVCPPGTTCESPWDWRWKWLRLD